MAAHLESFIEGSHRTGSGHAGDARFLNRELSWLDFNARVLSLADAPGTPLLERARFLAIFSQNLDEFFQVRVAGLKDQVAAGLGAVSADGLPPVEQLAVIRRRVQDLAQHQERIFLDEVVPALAEAGIHLAEWDALETDDRKHLLEVFEHQVFPVLTPLAVDPGHPFPYISNLSLNLAVMVRDPETRERRFARVKVPNLLPRYIGLPDGERYVRLEQLMAAHLGALFPGMHVETHHPFRVTRNADLTLEEDEADDLLAAVEIELRRRRFGRAVRLEVADDIDPEIRALLVRELDLHDDDVYATAAPLDLVGLWHIWTLPYPALKDEPFKSLTQGRIARRDDEPVDLFARIREGDILVHHPYESFTTSVSAFVRQAASDPDVLAIKQTLYRTSPDSPMVQALVGAAEQGKQVAALVELKARFDEQTNVTWARALEEAGVHVVYGLVGLKTHTKTALVVRRERDGIRRYCHIATGNYNELTAREYEDLGLLTCDPDIGADVSQLFNYLTGYGRQERFRTLIVAPGPMRGRLAALIRGEAAHDDGRITIKMNSLADVEMIDDLYAASQAGVQIDLIVRGICCLRPGVPGLSDNIRVRSIVGRYLEHSRVYRFGNGDGAGRPVYLMGSADLMPRNLDRRVEALVPVEDPELQARLQQVLDVNLADDELAWELLPDGSWRKVPTREGVNSHRALQVLATERTHPPGAGSTLPVAPDRQ